VHAVCGLASALVSSTLSPGAAQPPCAVTRSHTAVLQAREPAQQRGTCIPTSSCSCLAIAAIQFGASPASGCKSQPM